MNLVSSVVVKMVSTVWVTAVGLATSILLNRLLGPSDYGTLVLASAAAMGCWHFVDLGANATLSRYLPQHRANGRPELAAGLVRVGWGCLAAGLAAGGAGMWWLSDGLAAVVFRQPSLGPLIRTSLIYFAAFSVLTYVLQVLQAVQSWWRESLASALYPTLYLAGCAVAGARPAAFTVGRVLLINAAAALLTLAVVWGIAGGDERRALRGAGAAPRAAVRQARRHVAHFGAPLLANNLLFFMLMWADKLILGRSRSLHEVAFYYVGWSFLTALVTLTKACHTVLMPSISRVAAGGNARLQTAFRMLMFWFFEWSVGVSLVVFVLIEPLVKTLYGPAYEPASRACQWLLVVFVLRTWINTMGLFLHNAFGLGKTSVALSVLLVGCQVALSAWWVPGHGWHGAVWAHIVAYVVFGSAMAFGVPSMRRLWSWPLVLGCLGTAGGMIGAAAAVGMLLPSIRWATVPAVVAAVGWAVTYPMLRDRDRWQVAGSPRELWQSLRRVPLET